MFNTTIIRYMSLCMALFVVSSMHTDMAVTQRVQDVAISKISADQVQSRLPQAPRRAITSATHQSGVVDKKYRRLTFDKSVEQAKVVQAAFYIPPLQPDARSWFLVTYDNGRRHSLLYA
jgi:hypothetical protein